MAFKFVIITCLVALVRAGNIPAAVAVEPVVAAPAAAVLPAPQVVQARLEEFDTFPQYKFGYEVRDELTGDIKSQTEERSGDLVVGEYRLNEADGASVRIVTYSADAVNGFNALVRNEPLVGGPVVVAEPAAVEPAVVPARIAAAPVVPAARYIAPPAPVFAPRYTAAAFPSTLARYASYGGFQPFARLAAAPVSYPAPAPVVAV